MDELVRDLRFALRALARQPLFTLVAVATLALGVGANTAIFSVVYGVVLRPLALPEPDRLMTVWEDHSAFERPHDEWTSGTTLRDWQEGSTAFTALAGWGRRSPSLTGLGEPERLTAEVVSPAYFEVLGVQPQLGRAFVAEDGEQGTAPMVVISHRFWQDRFGGDDAVIGRTITLDSVTHEVVGVMPADFLSPLTDDAVLWQPGKLPYNDQERGSYYLRVIGRLAVAYTPAQGEAELEAVMGGLAERFPNAYEGIGITVVPLHERLVGPGRPALRALMLAVGFVLLVACANVANLLLARASVRKREMALRASLGAGRARLIRQLLTESLLLALAGGAAGIVLGAWGIDVLRTMLPAGTPRLESIALDLPVLLFALAVSVLTGVLFGLAPALEASRVNLSSALTAGSRGTDRRGGRLRASLVVAEVALALVLLVGAGLLVRSVWSLLAIDPGFGREGRLAARVTLPNAGYEDDEQIRAFWSSLVERLEAEPMVADAAATSVLPMDTRDQDTTFRIEGVSVPDPLTPNITWYRSVTAGYFETIGMRMVAGRGFEPRDREGAEPVAVVNETLVRRFFPVGNPVGRRIRFGTSGDRPWLTVVGVVADVRQQGLGEPPVSELFMPALQRPARSMMMVVRSTTAPPAMLAPVFRATLRALDPNLPIATPETLDQVVLGSVATPRLLMKMLVGFAAVALALATLGIYGLTAFSVARRTREIGVRVALGADGRDVRRLILGRGARLAGLGTLLGLCATLAGGRVLQSLLYEVSPVDPLTLASTAALLLTAALVACWLPARRAARLDPIIALREE